MNYKIFDIDGNEVNRVFASEDFVSHYCNMYGYTYEAEPMPEPIPEPEPEPSDTEVINALLGVTE